MQTGEGAASASLQHVADTDDDTEGLSEYERRRQQIIARNRQRLIELGLEKAVQDLRPLIQHKPKPHKSRVRHSAGLEGPVRRSSRIQELKEGGGKPRRKRSPPPPLEDLHEASRKRQRAAPGTSSHAHMKSEAEKLAELELGGLIDATEDHAKFMVLGSTGKHYTVTLSKEQHTCGCPDYRFRRHRCKHQQLVLSQLGVPDNPEQWHEAVMRQVQAGSIGQRSTS